MPHPKLLQSRSDANMQPTIAPTDATLGATITTVDLTNLDVTNLENGVILPTCQASPLPR